MPAATTANVRAPKGDAREVSAPFMLTVDYGIALNPIFLPYTGKLLLLAQQSAVLLLCSYVSPTGSRWLLSLQPSDLHSMPSEERKKRAGPPLLSRPPRSPLSSCTDIAVAVTGSHGYI